MAYETQKGRQPVCIMCRTPSSNFVIVHMEASDVPGGTKTQELQPRPRIARRGDQASFRLIAGDDAAEGTRTQEIESPLRIPGRISVAVDPPASYGFHPIAVNGYNGGMISLTIDPATTLNQRIPNTIFTIMPSEIIEISSHPAYLVTASFGRRNSLSLDWNTEVSATASGGGVRIRLPAHKLSSLRVGNGTSAQVLDGFTSVKKIDISRASSLKATFTSSGARSIMLIASGASSCSMLSGAIAGCDVSDNSTVSVQTPVVERVRLSGCSGLNVKGNVSSGFVAGCSQLKVTGCIAGAISVSGTSILKASSCGNQISLSGMSSYSSSLQRVSVDVSEEGHTRSGTCQATTSSANGTRATTVHANGGI